MDREGDSGQGYLFQVGDRVILARPHPHDAKDGPYNESFVETGAEGVVFYVHRGGIYQYGVEFRCGPLVVRRRPLQSQLDPAE